MEKNYPSVGDFAKHFGTHASTWIGRARHALIRETTEFMDEHTRREPVGSGPRYKGGKRPGALKASRKVTKGAEEGRVSWDAPHAAVINLGRKRSKPYSRVIKKSAGLARGRRGSKLGAAGTKPFTRMLGSKALRGGMTRPAFRALRRDWGKVISDSVQVAEGSA